MSRVMLFIWAFYLILKSALYWHLFLIKLLYSFLFSNSTFEILRNSSNIYLLLGEFIPHYLILTVTNKFEKKPNILIFLYRWKCSFFLIWYCKQENVSNFFSFLKYRKVVDEQRRGRNRSNYRFERCLVKIINSDQKGFLQERKIVENMWLCSICGKKIPMAAFVDFENHLILLWLLIQKYLSYFIFVGFY